MSGSAGSKGSKASSLESDERLSASMERTVGRLKMGGSLAADGWEGGFGSMSWSDGGSDWEAYGR